MTDIFETKLGNLFNTSAVTEMPQSPINVGHLGEKLVSYSPSHPALLIALAIIVVVTVVFLTYKYLSTRQTDSTTTRPHNTLTDTDQKTQAAAEAKRLKAEAAAAHTERLRIERQQLQEAERVKAEAANKAKAADTERLRQEIIVNKAKAAAAQAEQMRLEAEKAKAAAAPFEEQKKYLETVTWMEYKANTFSITGINASSAFDVLEIPVTIITSFNDKANTFKNCLNEAKEKLSANTLLEPSELSKIKLLQTEVQEAAKILYDACNTNKLMQHLDKIFIPKPKTN